MCSGIEAASVAVHPRLRGELIASSAGPIPQGGSSPLTRGTLRIRRAVAHVARFIPAYAGNSEYLITKHHLETVHPRLRGELSRRLRS